MFAELNVIHQGHHMKDLVKKFQTVRLAFQYHELFIRDIIFRLWERHTRQRRHSRKMAYLKALRYRWRRWRQFNKHKVEREMAEFSEDLEEKIGLLTTLSTWLEETEEVNSVNDKERQQCEVSNRKCHLLKCWCRNIYLRFVFSESLLLFFEFPY